MISVENIIIENKPLSNYELMDYAKRLKIKNFRGVFLRDELPNKIRKKECGIINLADSDDAEGSHWVCYFKDVNKKIYFDSYAVQPPLELRDYLGDSIEHNIYQIQKAGTVVCGHLCLYMLSKLSKGIKFDDVILKLI